MNNTHLVSVFLKLAQTLIVPAQKLAVEALDLLTSNSKSCNDVSWLLRLQKPSTALQPAELLSILFAHPLVMHFPDLSLHLRIYDAWSDRNRRYRGFFDRESESQVVQDGFPSAVATPALIGRGCGAAGG